jgi:CBS domain containing-hemolysin-like protein
MNEDLMGLIWLVVLLASNAFFVGAEFAVISARRSQIEPKADAGNGLARITLKAMEQVSLMLATAQLGITVSSLLILVIAEPAIHHLLEIPLSALGLGYATTSVTAFVIALLLVTYLHVVLGEMLPKNFAIAVPDKAALILGPAIYFVAQAVRPLVWTMNQISNLILRIFGFEPRDEANTAFTLVEVEGIVEESTKTGVLQDEGGTITKAFEFTETSPFQSRTWFRFRLVQARRICRKRLPSADSRDSQWFRMASCLATGTSRTRWSKVQISLMLRFHTN